MAYRIENVSLTSSSGTTNGLAGLVFSKSDIIDFLDDLRSGRHDQNYMVLSAALANQYEAQDADWKSKLRTAALHFAGSVAIGSGAGIISSLTTFLIQGPGKNFSSDAFDRITVILAWTKRLPVRFNDGRMGVLL